MSKVIINENKEQVYTVRILPTATVIMSQKLK